MVALKRRGATAEAPVGEGAKEEPGAAREGGGPDLGSWVLGAVAGLCLGLGLEALLRWRRPFGSPAWVELDRRQRETAATWEENDYCYGLVAYALEYNEPVSNLVSAEGGEMGFCMSAPALDFATREVEKERLLKRLAISWKAFEATAAGSAADMGRPERYVPSASAEEGGGGGDACELIGNASVREVAWGGAASGAAEAASDARASLQSDGAVLIRGVLTDGDLVSSARLYLLRKAVDPPGGITHYVHHLQHRHHLLLDPAEDPIVGQLYGRLVRVAGEVLGPLVSSLGTVVEFACFLTNPGAAEQGMHFDSRHEVDGASQWTGDTAPVYSLFLFLSDLDDLDMGPLQVVTRTHVRSGKVLQSPLQVAECAGDAGSLCPVRAGDMAVYDSTAAHRGRANGSDRTRIVVYLSVMGIGSPPLGPAFGAGNWMLDPPRRLGQALKDLERAERAP